MDYEEKYKRALKKAQELQENSNGMILKKWLWSVFPELKESEDEKVRNELISFIKKRDRSGCDYNYDQWIAWLEKQAERKTPQWMIDFLDNYRRKIGCSLDYDEARDVDGKILCIKEWLEKQGVQKSIDMKLLKKCKE